MTPTRVAIGFLVLIVLGLQTRLWVGEGSFAHVDGLQQQVERERTENAIKEQRNRVLRAEILELKNGLDAIEEKARSEFSLIKEGETFFLLVEDEPSPRS
ncbi:MAG: septum formation initiator family protein [Pseudomonadales bacterium]|nr:septum formation initiator family protein [Pseudomonadales bacterium]